MRGRDRDRLTDRQTGRRTDRQTDIDRGGGGETEAKGNERHKQESKRKMKILETIQELQFMVTRRAQRQAEMCSPTSHC